jgi:hypothetical protein
MTPTASAAARGLLVAAVAVALAGCSPAGRDAATDGGTGTAAPRSTATANAPAGGGSTGAAASASG